MKNNTTSAAKLFLAALGGVAVGSAISLYLAPDKGSKMRRKLNSKGGNSIEDHIDEIISQGKKSWKELKASAEDTTEDIDGYFQHLMTEGKKSWEKMKTELENRSEDAAYDAKGTVSKAMDEGKSMWNNFTSKAEATANEARQATKETFESTQHKADNMAKHAKNDLSI
jgi:gas vesicle protein